MKKNILIAIITMLVLILVALLSLLLIFNYQNEKYELIFGKDCMNCYALIYEFKDGTKIYHDCPDIKYKSNNKEISLKEALDKKLIKLDDLKEYGFKIVDSNTDSNESCCFN